MSVERGRVALVDSNVIIDVRTEDPVWYEWSAGALADAADRYQLAINPIIYAEVSVDAERIEDLDLELPERDYLRLPLPYEAGFLAGKAFVSYRRAGGERDSPLPDFYIGAHAAVQGLTLVTRDAARYQTYFPSVSLIKPST
ncbi:MAG TPA: type II toxin-antitoxin system VapC family toxin [Gaiellaceae bacterium]|nr:type II toxin-antitoxin system VapC family toxin [Gaiellaceae bacterium]